MFAMYVLSINTYILCPLVNLLICIMYVQVTTFSSDGPASLLVDEDLKVIPGKYTRNYFCILSIMCVHNAHII